MTIRKTIRSTIRRPYYDLVIPGSGLNPSNEPEVTAYIAGLATPLSAGEITLLNTLAVDLKTGLNINAISEAFDLFNIRSGETAEVSLRNFAKNAHHSTAVNSPTFKQYEGFTFNGTSQYLNLNYNPSLHASAFGKDNATLMILARINDLNQIINIGAGEIGKDGIILSVVWGTYYFKINDATSSDVIKDIPEYVTITRLSSTTSNVYRNKEAGTPKSVTSTNIVNLTIYEGATNRSSISYGKNMSGFSAIGKGLTQSEIAVVINAVEKYNNAHGKGILA